MFHKLLISQVYRLLFQRYEDGLAESEFHDDTKARQLYFEAIDLAVNCIQDRFQQPDYKVYSNLEQLILKAAEGEDITAELDFVIFTRQTWIKILFELNYSLLESNLNNLRNIFSRLQAPREVY